MDSNDNTKYPYIHGQAKSLLVYKMLCALKCFVNKSKMFSRAFLHISLSRYTFHMKVSKRQSSFFSLQVHKFGFKNFFKMAPHTGSATPEQIDTLLDFLQEHRDLARGRLRSIEGKVEAKRLWSELCNTLNSMGGCTKTVQQWQKVWADKKHLAKKAAADSRRSASATGGGPSTAPQLSQWELRIMAIMGEGFGERQTGARVPAFQTSEPSTSSQESQSLSFPQPPQQEITVEYLEMPVESLELSDALPQEPRQLSQEPSQLSQEPSTSSRSSQQPTRPRRRRSAAGSDVRSRLFQFEEGREERETLRNTELAGIRAELAGIRRLLQEYLDRRN